MPGCQGTEFRPRSDGESERKREMEREEGRIITCYNTYLIVTTTITIEQHTVIRLTITPSPPIKSLAFRRFDSSRLLILRGGNPCPLNLIGSLPESLPQGLLIGKLLIGGLGVV